MLNLGIIGYGRRISHMAQRLNAFNIPCRIAAIADPRSDEIRTAGDDTLSKTTFYESADELLSHPDQLDGVMVGTRCFMHTEMACKVAPGELPLFLEKPVAISFDQVRQLKRAFKDVKAPVVVSFPLRLSPVLQKVKEIVDSDQIGTVEQIVAVNDVPYGHVYYQAWFRNYDQSGGLFLQKATHDIDYMNYLMDQTPRRISAMKALRVFGGDRPFNLRCETCDENETCTESPLVRYREGFEGSEVAFDQRNGACMFSEGLELEDMGSCQIEYENGAQASYTQNFFARHNAGRRGARLYGYKGTIEFDWYLNQIKVHSHRSPVTETIDFTGSMPHFGGDRELSFDFVMAMRDGKPSRTPIEAGIESALTCLWAREAAETHRVCEVAGYPD